MIADPNNILGIELLQQLQQCSERDTVMLVHITTEEQAYSLIHAVFTLGYSFGVKNTFPLNTQYSNNKENTTYYIEKEKRMTFSDRKYFKERDEYKHLPSYTLT